jgi:hypothetical protein
LTFASRVLGQQGSERQIRSTRSRPGALPSPSLRRLQPRRTGPLVKTRCDIGLTRSLEKSFALWTRRQSSGLLADLIGPGCQPVSKGQNLLEAASTLHDTTSSSSRVLTVGFESTDHNMPCSGGRSPSRQKVTRPVAICLNPNRNFEHLVPFCGCQASFVLRARDQ